ncbi:hypothetical protein HWV62_14780 [Athelia sp. TMB]|nr:hypothetical protein HWV62_14780 [Athelia sp. TMB]
MPMKGSSQTPTSSQNKPRPKPKSKVKTVKLDVSGGPGPSSAKRLKPLTAFVRPPGPDGSSQPSRVQSQETVRPASAKEVDRDAKGKKKADPEDIITDDNRLWVDIYQPTTEEDLAVHKKKVEDVRRWFLEAFEGGPSGKLKKYRRILALTGPAGTAKTATLHVLARELGFEVLEWRNGVHISETRSYDDAESEGAYTGDNETLFAKFEAFLTRASACSSLFSASASASHSSQPASTGARRRVILLEDLPNILHARTQEQFHETLTAMCTAGSSSTATNLVPIVIVISDAGTRGEARDELVASGGGWGGGKEVVLDVRSVLGGLLGSQWVTQIAFNPIAPTLLKRALQALLSTHFSSSQATQPSKEVVDIVVSSSNGDIRSAINALQFASIPAPFSTSTKRKKGDGKDKRVKRDAKVVLEAVTRRESSLALFHLMGKVLYNKRKGDAPSSSASKAEAQREREQDALRPDPSPLPTWLEDHERATSRVDVDTLYADSPIDSSLFSLYLHQNYPPFCSTIEECASLADWLSWTDASGGEQWYQANPAQFHLLALGALHSLPTPVERRGQVFCKPQFFEALRREKEAGEAVVHVQRWLSADGAEGSRGWGKAEIVTEFGGVFRARDRVLTAGPHAGGLAKGLPANHRLFTVLSNAASGATVLGEGDGGDETLQLDEEANLGYIDEDQEQDEGGGWLDSDDIEDC